MSNILRTQLLTVLDSLAANQVPSYIPDMENDFAAANLYDLQFQHQLQVTHKMFGLVDLKWTKKFADLLGSSRCLEIMAGRGWLASALAYHGVNIHATDGHIGFGVESTTSIFPVGIFTATEAIKQFEHRSDVLICSWPPYLDTALNDALNHWPSDKPIYIIGEGPGGCTGDDSFWDQFDITDTYRWQPNQWGQHSALYRGYWK